MTTPRITLQFHPNWPYDGGTVIDAMAASGVYRSQFETGISNGGRTAFVGGARWHWESRLFDGRYDDADASARPVYGAWNRRNDTYGGAIRFGSSYVRLRPEVIERTTFCFPDSSLNPVDVGGPEILDHLAALADASGLDDLDDCVEAQVHGGVTFERDIEAIVLDPSFASTSVEVAARTLGCEVEFHPGFIASPEDFDPEYRGQNITTLARSLGEVLTPELLGRSALRYVHPPQELKQVWHCLARYGRSLA